MRLLLASALLFVGNSVASGQTHATHPTAAVVEPIATGVIAQFQCRLIAHETE